MLSYPYGDRAPGCAWDELVRLSRLIGQLPEGEVAAIGSKSQNRAEGDAEVVACAVVEVDLVAEFEAQP
jgi:hypothetical protein